MNPLDFINPIEIYKFLQNAYKSWKGFKLLIFGTQKVGKTTLWHYLQTNKIVPDDAISSTLEINSIDKFRLKSIRLGFTKVGVLAMDVPGNKELRDLWKIALNEVQPDGIIFLLDNVENSDENIPELGYDDERLKEHKEAFDYLSELLIGQPQLTKKLQALAVVVNKCDTFPREMGNYGKIIKEADIGTNINQYSDFHHCRTTAFGCSAKYGDNIHQMMEWMVKNMAK